MLNKIEYVVFVLFCFYLSTKSCLLHKDGVCVCLKEVSNKNPKTSYCLFHLSWLEHYSDHLLQKVWRLLTNELRAAGCTYLLANQSVTTPFLEGLRQVVNGTPGSYWAFLVTLQTSTQKILSALNSGLFSLLKIQPMGRWSLIKQQHVLVF